MKNFIFYIFVLYALTSAHVQAQVKELDGLDKFMKQTMELTQTQGVAVAVVRGDKVIYTKGFGVREVGKKAPVDKDTLFAIGSNTKYFTATAVGMLVDEGKLSWDEPLTKYLPKLRFSDPYLFTELTLRDALSHRTGLARADAAWYARPEMSRADALAMIEHLPLELSFRSGFIYNNFMFVAAGETIPAVSDNSWDEMIKERFFVPLKMGRSNTSVRDLKGMDNVATPHTIIDGKVLAIPYHNIDAFGAAGSINSSVADMAQWCKVQLANGKLGDKQIIPEAIIDVIRQPHTLMPLNKESSRANAHLAYSLGIARLNNGPHTTYTHTGGIDGMLSSFTFIPEPQLCVVTLTNTAPNYGLHSIVSSWVVDHMLGMGDDDHLAKFTEGTEKQKTKAAEDIAKHIASAAPSVKPSVPLESYVGTYDNETFGELVISLADNTLRFGYGSVFVGSLKHHRGDSFDLVNDVPERNGGVFNLSFSIDGKGNVESVLMDNGISPTRYMMQKKKQK